VTSNGREGHEEVLEVVFEVAGVSTALLGIDAQGESKWRDYPKLLPQQTLQTGRRAANQSVAR
jgi:hypothetical protein